MTRISLERWNNGLSWRVERRALFWLAARMPRWVTPDILTGFGFLGALVTFAAYAWSGSNPGLLWIATLGFAINWFGDSLDGTLARLRKIERPRYGYYLDNSIDCVAALLLALGLAISGYIRADLCFLALATYTMLSALTFLRANIGGIFQISYVAIGPTEMRIVFVVLNALLFFFPPVPFDFNGLKFAYPDLLSLAWSALMTGTFIVCMASQARRLAIEEPAAQRTLSLRKLGQLASSSQRASRDDLGAFSGEQRLVR
jgi:phosphatidylglycerophosphate synthase